MIKKADILLFFIILILGIAVSWWSLGGTDTADRVVITVSGQVYGTYSLWEDQEIEVKQNGHQNHITIKNGQVSMTFSSCKNQVCVDTGVISTAREAIVCLPNKVMVEIESSKGGGPDVVTG